jgi:cytoskeletal protein RodZ
MKKVFPKIDLKLVIAISIILVCTLVFFLYTKTNVLNFIKPSREQAQTQENIDNTQNLDEKPKLEEEKKNSTEPTQPTTNSVNSNTSTKSAPKTTNNGCYYVSGGNACLSKMEYDAVMALKNVPTLPSTNSQPFTPTCVEATRRSALANYEAEMNSNYIKLTVDIQNQVEEYYNDLLTDEQLEANINIIEERYRAINNATFSKYSAQVNPNGCDVINMNANLQFEVLN